VTSALRIIRPLAAGLVAGLAAAAAWSGLAPAAPAEAATRSPIDVLRAGPAPRSVPYAIGTSVYYRGHRTDIGARIDGAFYGARPSAAQRQLTAVTGGAGFAWAQFTGSGADIVHIVGRIGPGGGWTGFHSSSGAFSRLAVTTTGLVAMPESGSVYRADGRLAATFTGSTATSCGYCGAAAAGPYLVVERKPSLPGTDSQGIWLWRPAAASVTAAAPVRLPDGYAALGRLGGGWLGALQSPARGATCWRIAPAADPVALRARICSQTVPLVSADGVRAVVVQGGRTRVVDTRTGGQLSLAGLGALAGWSPDGGPTGRGTVRYVVPAAWETADTFVATARDDQVLALVRCSATTGRCERVVRATVRPGVAAIVSERGAADSTPMG
jgi:hypothetical protein